MKTKFISIFAIFAVIVVGGCGAKPAPALTESSESAAAVKNAMDKLREAKLYSVILDGNQVAQRNEWYVEKPDIAWSKTDNVGEHVEFMVLGNDKYYKDENEPWEKNSENTSEIKFEDLEFSKMLEGYNCKDFSFESKTLLDNKSALIYTGKCPKPEGGEYIIKYWLSDESGMPSKIEIIMSRSEAGDRDSFDSKLVTVLFDYNKKIDLKPPITQ